MRSFSRCFAEAEASLLSARATNSAILAKGASDAKGVYHMPGRLIGRG
jgi:hypothetical protein